MLPTLVSLLGLAAAGSVAVAAIAVAGLRFEWSPVVDAIRRLNRRLNRAQLDTAGMPGAFAGLLHHVGRASGSAYATPVSILPLGDDFVIAIVYGSRTSWVLNVMAAGAAAIELEGEHHAVDRPRIVPISTVAEAFPAGERRLQRLLAIDRCLLLHRAAAADNSAGG